MHVSLAQFRPRKGELAENLERVRQIVESSVLEGVDLLIFPETALTGYFLEGAVAERSVSPEQVVHRLGSPPRDAPDLVLGAYERGREGVHNMAVYLTPGAERWEVVHVHRKLFLPTYGVFDEARFVSPGFEARAFDTRWGRVGLLVCEDMHHSLVPTLLALDGADLLICLAASPVRDFHAGSALPGSLERWDAVGRAIAMEHGAHLLVCHLVGSEGGKIFPGGSVGYDPDGRILGRGPLFEEAQVDFHLDPDEPIRARTRASALSDLRIMLPHLLRGLDPRERERVPAEESRAPRGQGRSSAASSVPARPPERSGTPGPLGPDPEDGSVLELDLQLMERALVGFLVDEVHRRRGFEGVVVGLSGGVDSAVSAALAVQAFGASNVHGLLLPYATSSPESLEHGRLVAETFGIEVRTIPISAAVDAYVDKEEPGISDLRRGNVAARFRSLILWDQSARLGVLPLGTGNKSERLLGYYTWHADDSPPVNPLGDLFKTQVWALARHLQVPEAVVAKPPSADLVEGVDDEDELGVGYELADRILFWLLRGLAPARLVAAGFPEPKVALVSSRLEGTHWKREQPTIAMMSSTAIGEFYLRPVDL
jgi:NAD+ synthase (glutamine-hydrolysing)